MAFAVCTPWVQGAASPAHARVCTRRLDIAATPRHGFGSRACPRSDQPSHRRVIVTASDASSPPEEPSADDSSTKTAGSLGSAGRYGLVAAGIALVAALMQHQELAHHSSAVVIAIFLVGYGSIVLEGILDVNKAASALLMGAGTWTTLVAAAAAPNIALNGLNESALDVAQILLFLAGAMATVEIMDGHDSFRVVTDRLPRGSMRQLLWAISLSTFFLSSVLDDLTTTIVMLSLLKRIIPNSDVDQRRLLGGAVVIAANSGGAWSPIGDVTTTLIWQHGNISVLPTVVSLVLPSLVCMLIGVGLISGQVSNDPVKSNETNPNVDTNGSTALQPSTQALVAKEKPPGSETVFWSGMGALLFVPFFKTLTGLPPYLAISVSLGFMWLLTDLLHAEKDEREDLRAENLVKKVDITSLTFFMGILLTMGGLQYAGLLEQLSTFLDTNIPSKDIIAALIGVASALVDNVALVAATLGMWTLDQVPMNASIWQEVAFCAGTGGSILSIGSAAGVTLMILDRVTFTRYLRTISLPAAAGFFGGFLVFLTLNTAGLTLH